MNNMTITLDLANKILGYLGKRPYEEVFQLIDQFQSEHKSFIDSIKPPTDADGNPMTGFGEQKEE